MRLKLIALCVLAFGSAADAAEIWTCAYVVPRTKVTEQLRYSIDGDHMVTMPEPGRPLVYNILVNNEFGIVGVFGLAATNGKISRVAGSMVVIDKKTNELLATSLLSGEANDVLPGHGTCTHSQ